MPEVITGIGAAVKSFGAWLWGAKIAGVAVGKMIILGGGRYALSAAARALTKGATPRQRVAGYRLMCRMSDAPWRIIYGRARVSGVITFPFHVTGVGGEYVHFVLTLCKGPIEEIGEMRFNGEVVTLDGSGDATGKYAGYAHVEKNLGTDDQAAFPGLIAWAPTKWTASHRQRGHAGAYIRLRWNTDLYPSGTPNITFDIKGRKVFDPRTSQTAYSENVALALRDYHMNTKYGLACAGAEVNDTVGNASANICDEDVITATGTEDRYTANGIFETSETPSSIIRDLLTAMAGDYTYVGGCFEWYAAAWRAPTVSLGDSDVRAPLQDRARVGRHEIFNAVKGIYTAPINNWQPADFPVVTSEDYEAEDGERIWRDVEYRFTISPATAQRIAKLELESIRRQHTVTLPCKLAAYEIQPPHVVEFTHARFAWTNKTFKVVESALAVIEDEQGAPALAVDLVLRQTDAAVYGWTSEEEGTVDAPPGTDMPDMSTVAPPTNLELTSSDATALTRVDGVRISRIKPTWTPPLDEFVLSGGRIVFQYKKSAEGTWLPAGTAPGTSVEHYVTGVNDGVAYDVRCWAENTVGAKSTVVTVTNHTVSGPSSAVLEQVGRRVGTHGQNLLFNFGFEDNATFWQVVAGFSVQTDSTKARSGNKYLQSSVSTTKVLYHTDDAGGEKFFEVNAGDLIAFGGYAYRESGDGNLRFRISVWDKDKANPTNVRSPDVTAAAWTKTKTTYTVAAGKKYISFWVEHNVPTVASVGRFDDVFLMIVRDLDTGVADGANFKRLQQGTKADRPAAGTAGRVYHAYDTDEWFRDNGASWDLIAGRSLRNKVVGVTNAPSTISGDWAVIPEMTVDYTPKTSRVLLIFCSSFYVSSAGAGMNLAPYIGGVQISDSVVKQSLEYTSGVINAETLTLVWLQTGLTPGTEYTFDIRWRNLSAPSPAIYALATARTLTVEDII